MSLLKVVSSSAVITDEGRVVLPGIDAGVSGTWQASIGRVDSISFQFRVPHISWLKNRKEGKNNSMSTMSPQ